MSMRLISYLCLLCTFAVSAASSVSAREADVARGEYLVNLLGCGRCHTEGYLLGNDASGPHLAGSRVGIAYSGGTEEPRPGLVFAPNLTPHDETGLGRWSRRDIVRALTTGVGTDGHQRLPVMPWPNYGAMDDRDVKAVADYLLSLPPVRREIPATTSTGDAVEHPYVRFGIYVFTPFEDD
ncbi:MAG: c-type cytochrome [Gammaproteobacteria bacterium]|nr:c-type cytochrome [Gammaproteobacteria bacterium]